MSEEKIWLIFGAIMLFPPIVNVIIAPYLDRYTRPNETNDESGFGFILLFFGIFCLPFIKKIRKTRLIWYLENILENNKRKLRRLKYVHGYTDDIEISKLEKEILLLERKLKLEKLKK